MKLYHNRKVHDNCAFTYRDMGLKMKIPRDHEKQAVPNSDGNCFPLLFSFQSFFVTNSDGSATFFLILAVSALISNHNFSASFSFQLW